MLARLLIAHDLRLSHHPEAERHGHRCLRYLEDEHNFLPLMSFGSSETTRAAQIGLYLPT